MEWTNTFTPGGKNTRAFVTCECLLLLPFVILFFPSDLFCFLKCFFVLFVLFCFVLDRVPWCKPAVFHPWSGTKGPVSSRVYTSQCEGAGGFECLMQQLVTGAGARPSWVLPPDFKQLQWGAPVKQSAPWRKQGLQLAHFSGVLTHCNPPGGTFNIHSQYPHRSEGSTTQDAFTESLLQAVCNFSW